MFNNIENIDAMTYLTFDNIENDIVIDEKNNNNGIIYGNPNIIEGKIKNGISLSNNDKIVLENYQNFNNINFSVSCFIKNWTNGFVLFSNWYRYYPNSNGNGRIYYGCYCIIQNDQIKFVVFRGSYYSDILISNLQISNTSLNHIVCIRDTTNGYMKIYINGILDNEINISSSPNYSNHMPMSIGYMDYNGYFGGNIDEWIYFNRIINDNEVIQLYNLNKHYNTFITSMNYNIIDV